MKEVDIDEARLTLSHTAFSTWLGMLLMTPAKLAALPVADIAYNETGGNVKKMARVVDELRRHGFITLMDAGRHFCLHATGKMAITPQIRRYRSGDEPRDGRRRIQ